MSTERLLRLFEDGRRGEGDAMAEYNETLAGMSKEDAIRSLRETYKLFPEVTVEFLMEQGDSWEEIRSLLGIE